jgi:hypothetical protein
MRTFLHVDPRVRSVLVAVEFGANGVWTLIPGHRSEGCDAVTRSVGRQEERGQRRAMSLSGVAGQSL